MSVTLLTRGIFGGLILLATGCTLPANYSSWSAEQGPTSAQTQTEEAKPKDPDRRSRDSYSNRHRGGGHDRKPDCPRDRRRDDDHRPGRGRRG